MMNARVKIFFAVLIVMIGAGELVYAGQTGTPDATNGPKGNNNIKRTTRSQTGEDKGEIVFLQHCSRCHNAPESISPRIAGTVVRHMRVRANLTAEEERAVLHFFNP